jgi:uncharacterized protein YbjT (DUF2867 family)
MAGTSTPYHAGRSARGRRYRVNSVILVTGATGRVGYHLMEALADAHADVTAMVRVEARAADLPGTPQHVVAAFDDPPPAEVLRGFDRVFLLSPAIEEQASWRRCSSTPCWARATARTW